MGATWSTTNFGMNATDILLLTIIAAPCTGTCPSCGHRPCPLQSPRAASQSHPRSPTTCVPSKAEPLLAHAELTRRLLFEPTEFAYFWQRTSPSLGDIEAGVELLQWNPPESTYRTVEIPLPGSARPGESWRLGLYVDNADAPPITRYADDQPGVIGVWSEPIALVRGEPSSSGNVRGVGGLSAKDKKDSKKGKGKAKEDEGKKQGRIQREWTVGSRALRIVEQTSFDLDKVSFGVCVSRCAAEKQKIWDSGLGLSGWLRKYLAEEHINRKTSSILTSLGTKEDLNVLEIGELQEAPGRECRRAKLTDQEAAPDWSPSPSLSI